MGRGTETSTPSHDPGGKGRCFFRRRPPGRRDHTGAMTGYLVRRLWQSLLVLFGISIIIFTILHLTGDPAVLLMPPDATQGGHRQLPQGDGLQRPALLPVAALGASQPALAVPHGHAVRALLHGRGAGRLRQLLPPSAAGHGPGLERMPATIQLTLTAMAIAVCVAVPVGILSAVRRNSALDHAGHGAGAAGAVHAGLLARDHVHPALRRPAESAAGVRGGLVAAPDPAGHHAGGVLHGADRPPDALQHAGGSGAGVRADRARQGAARSSGPCSSTG